MRLTLLVLVFLLVPAIVQAYCGDGVCNVVAGESRRSCCDDCPCGYSMICTETGSCEFAEVSNQQITGHATYLYGFEPVLAGLVALMAVGVLVLYKFRSS